jgi:N-methylhydantoinase A
MRRIAIDAGGTFTDVIVLDADGRVTTHKVLSNPDDPADGMLSALDIGSADLTGVGTLVNGTTAGLNAVLARTGTRVAMITTEGFRDVLELARAERTDVWKLKYEPAKHVVETEDVLTIAERVLVDGTVSVPLDVEGLASIVAHIDAHDIRSVAVCFLHATRNPLHELAVRDALRERRPDVKVSLSHEVAPEIGEYERFSSTVVNAYVATVVGDYLSRAEAGVADRGYTRPLLVMRSSGGVTSAKSARKRPIQTLVSGPSGGVVGAEVVANALGTHQLLAVDMGGTSLDASVIIDGTMGTASTFDLDGLPVQMPVVDLVTIGAGGGSIAWLEDGGLRVGPRSAGARPGPACYGFGGGDPTVTDANLLLGRLGTEGLANDSLRLDRDAACKAFEPLAAGLGLTLEGAAEAVIAVTNAKMADALREITIRRGHDPREFALLAFGGAGPLHAVALAEEMEIDTVIVPPAPGVFSAWGMLHAPIRHDIAHPLLVPTDSPQAEGLANLHGRLLAEARALVAEDDIDPDSAQYVAAVDMRYEGQQFTLAVEAPVGSSPATWDAQFRADYKRAYGEVAGRPGTELVNARVTARGPASAPIDGQPDTVDREASKTSIVFDGGRRECAVIDRRALEGTLAGPVIVLDGGSTIFVPPRWTASKGRLGSIHIVRGEA